MENNIPAEALPNQEFMEMVNRIEGTQKPVESPTSPSDDVIMVETPAGPVPLHTKASVATKIESKDSSEALPQKQPEEIKLEYRFSGDCKTHLIPVSTLTAEVDGKCLVFAFCKECNKNVRSQVVPLLPGLYDEWVVNEPEIVKQLQKKRTFTRKKKEIAE